MTTHTLHILCKYIFVLPPITLLLLLAHNLILSRIQPHHRHRRQWEKTKNKLNFFPSLSLDPPSTPIITGYTEGSVIPAGSSQKLLCMSSGGNPPPILTWYKNDKKVNRSWLSSRTSYRSPFQPFSDFYLVFN